MINMKEKTRDTSEQELAETERVLQAHFTEEFKAFILEHNGCSVERNIIRISENEDNALRYFLDVKDIPACLSSLQDDYTQKHYFPFAEGECGAFFLMKKQGDPGIYYYDPDYMGQDAITKLSDDWQGFLDKIQPDTTDLSEADQRGLSNAVVWVRPGFLESLDKKYLIKK
ncbi:SMI1/KNR4 family protein [Acetobacter persici]|uniref:SMI1/KNR4 family protein n=1 Tax=Acetobacter persici TaxID=1076596 RepID=UPI0039EA044F